MCVFASLMNQLILAQAKARVIKCISPSSLTENALVLSSLYRLRDKHIFQKPLINTSDLLLYSFKTC